MPVMNKCGYAGWVETLVDSLVKNGRIDGVQNMERYDGKQFESFPHILENLQQTKPGHGRYVLHQETFSNLLT